MSHTHEMYEFGLRVRNPQQVVGMVWVFVGLAV
jgi:hypothetical protein